MGRELTRREAWTAAMLATAVAATLVWATCSVSAWLFAELAPQPPEPDRVWVVPCSPAQAGATLSCPGGEVRVLW